MGADVLARACLRPRISVLKEATRVFVQLTTSTLEVCAGPAIAAAAVGTCLGRRVQRLVLLRSSQHLQLVEGWKLQLRLRDHRCLILRLRRHCLGFVCRASADIHCKDGGGPFSHARPRIGAPRRGGQAASSSPASTNCASLWSSCWYTASVDDRPALPLGTSPSFISSVNFVTSTTCSGCSGAAGVAASRATRSESMPL